MLPRLLLKLLRSWLFLSLRLFWYGSSDRSPGQSFEFDLLPPEVEEDGLVGSQAPLGVVGANPPHHARLPVHFRLVDLSVLVH
jgi:hypothetical protein